MKSVVFFVLTSMVTPYVHASRCVDNDIYVVGRGKSRQDAYSKASSDCKNVYAFRTSECVRNKGFASEPSPYCDKAVTGGYEGGNGLYGIGISEYFYCCYQD